MRFITEFVELEHEKGQYHKMYQQDADFRLGTNIHEQFGYSNPVNGNPHQFKLEIEAFPMDKWVEFKKRLTDALPNYDVTSRTRIINALSDLETSLPLNLHTPLI